MHMLYKVLGFDNVHFSTNYKSLWVERLSFKA